MKRKVDYSCKVAMLAMLLPVLLQNVPALAQAANNASNTSTLTLAVFMSGITPNGTNAFAESLDGRPFITAVELALELVNNRSDILPGYTLEFTANDSRCQSAPIVRGFIDQIFMEPTKIMIIGSDCSISTSPVAELAPFWNLVQISPVSTSPELSDSNMFSTFLRMASSDTAIVDGIVTLMTRFMWSRIAVISQQETIFTSTFSALQRALMANNFTAPRDFTFNSGDNPQGQVMSLANSPTRIIFLNVYPSYALEILCQARMEGMTLSNGYVWLLFAWYQDNWWQDEPLFLASYNQINCSSSEMEEILDRAILIDHFPFVPPENRSMTTDAGMTREEFDDVIRSRLGEDFDQSYLDQVPFVFDAVWTGALALNATQAEYNLSEFTYDQVPLSRNITTSIYQNALAHRFRGMSGEVAFDDTGDRNSVLRFFQYRRNESGGLSRVLIGSDEFFESDDSIFPQGIPQDEQYIFINLAVFIVYTILSFAGIVLALVFLTINLYFREKKVVKFSSPYLNILIIVGAIMFYVVAIFLGVDEGITSKTAVDVFCTLEVWIASIAFSLIFGTILAKTWRVYYVFFNTTRRKKKRDKVIPDWVLFVMVGCLVAIDIVFLLFVTAFSTSRLQLQRSELPSNSRALPRIIGVCDAQDRFVWLGILFAYKGILLIVGVFLAFENRNAKLPQFNDSKLMGMSVYIIVVLSLVLGALGIVLETFIEAYYAVIGIMIILGTTGVLCLIFIPKIYGLWKPSDDYDVTSGPVGTTNSKETITQLAQEVEMLQREKMELETIAGQGNHH